MRPGGRHSRRKGEVTDDTLQAMAVAESLVACTGFFPPDLVQRLFSGYRMRPAWYGPTSSLFFDLVASGTPPHRAAWLVHRKRGSSRTNGSVMRGFPLGIFYPAPEVYTVSLACSRLTHYDPVAAHCSAWLNLMASDMVRGISRRRAYRHARSHCTDPEVQAVLGNFPDHAPVSSPDAVRCSHAALSCFMNARTLEGAILSAINLGGDADTAGACCGALAGAYWGPDAIPRRWLTDLEGRDAILHCADRLWNCAAQVAQRSR
jgi:ADP-ribosyl-[dinitrogen reductase] hydrolase